MFAEAEELFRSQEAVERTAILRIVMHDSRFTPGPVDIFCERKETLEHHSLRGDIHVDTAVGDSGDSTGTGHGLKMTIIVPASSCLVAQLHVAVHRLAGRSLHDDMDRWAIFLSVDQVDGYFSPEELQDLCLAHAKGNLIVVSVRCGYEVK